MVWYTKSQVKNLKADRKKYVKRYGKSKLPQAFFHLNDNPAKRCVMTSPTACLPTLRKAMGPIHCQGLKRPVTPREALTAMGFIAYDSVAKATNYPMKLPESLMDSPAVRPMTGNAMHLPNATIVTVVAMACVQLITTEEASFRGHIQRSRSEVACEEAGEEDPVAGLVHAFQEYVKKQE